MQRDRAKEHKKVVKYMRMRNKELNEDDYVGCGRFRIDSFCENWERFEDGSGGRLSIVCKMSDTLTGNNAFFMCDNYDYEWRIFEYLNDFLIRCSDGHSGHFPSLHYIAYDIQYVIPYAGCKKRNVIVCEEGIVDKYDWSGLDVFNEE